VINRGSLPFAKESLGCEIQFLHQTIVNSAFQMVDVVNEMCKFLKIAITIRDVVYGSVDYVTS
jgi:hypothetical protein